MLRLCLVGENIPELLHDFLLGMGPSDGELLYQKVAGGIEHFSLPKGELFIALEHKQIPKDLRDF